MGTDFWIGSLLGFLAISGTLLTMFLLHGFRVIGMAIHGTTILPSLIGWGIAYLMVGLFEEFAFRRIRTAHSPPESALARGVRDVRIVRVGPSHRQPERECSGRGSCCALRTPPLPVFAADRESVVCGRLSFGLRLGASVLWSSGQWHRALSQSVQFRLSWAALLTGGVVGPEASILTRSRCWLSLCFSAVTIARMGIRRLSQVRRRGQSRDFCIIFGEIFPVGVTVFAAMSHAYAVSDRFRYRRGHACQ
jgi:hypothetical protein